MREIKFRVWDISGQQFLSNVDRGEDLEPLYENKSRLEELTLGWATFNNQDYIVQQFTGLQDKNGKDIYEGDIIKVLDENRDINYTTDVVFAEGSFLTHKFIDYADCCSGEINYPVLAEVTTYCEVVGNIFEAPELLKKACPNCNNDSIGTCELGLNWCPKCKHVW